MTDEILQSAFKTMDDRDFYRISKIIEDDYGIKMPPEKKVLLECRLNKRLKALNMESFREYSQFLFENNGLEQEIVNLIDAVSTNKTDFFREPAHFDYLVNTALPEILTGYSFSGRRKILMWSSACSSGEEPYSMAMAAEDFRGKNRNLYPFFDFIILGTDISQSMLNIANRAVYQSKSIETIPDEFHKKYLLKSKNPAIQEFRIIPEIRSKVRFYRLNLMDNDFGLDNKFDIIFCRNVMIYFRKETQEELIKKFSRYLNNKGFLFIGHSETLINMDSPFIMTSPTIYRRKDV